MFLTTTISAQDYWKQSRYALVYKVTNEQAEQLATASFEKNIAKSEEIGQLLTQLKEPIDTIFTPSSRFELVITPSRDKYPLGHYVAVRATGEYLEYKFLGFYDIGIVPIVHDKKFHFHIIDTLGNFVQGSEVKLDGKTVKYNESKERYEHRKFKNTRFLVVERNGQKAFFEVDANHSDNYYGRDNWFVRTWYKIRDANIWYNPLYALNNTWRRIYYPVKAQWEVKTYGYITTNKPKYLPNDTVKIKAYLVRDNKIPYNMPLTLKITQYGNYNFQTTVKSTSKGSYVFEFPLGDSLQLDRSYTVTFYKGKRHLLSTYFTYEDYQLDEISYELRADKKKFKRTEPIVFYAEGKDKNGQNVMDGDVELTATITNINAFHAKEVLIPDTLFHYKGALELGGEMRFPLPKETIPMMDFNVNVYAVFTNSNGELHTKNLGFEILSDTAYIEMSMNGDTLLVDYIENDKSIPTMAKLEFDLQATNFYVEKTVQLPYKAVINPVFSQIKVQAKYEYQEINFSGYNNSKISAPTFDLIQTVDSVYVFGNNPSGLKVHYEVNRINRKIHSGESSERTIIWKDKIRRKTSYRIDYEYVLNGKGIQNSQNFNYGSNQLTIEIDQPDEIQPGETVDVKVKVRKANKNNARNVNLVAGAINTQFGNVETWKYNVPFYGEVSDEKGTNYYYRNNLKYSVGATQRFNWTKDINPRIRKDLQLEQDLYYKLLFPKNGRYSTQRDLKRDSFALAEVVPFVVKDGKFQAIYMVYVNRGFSYYYDTETPYSIKGREGYNQLIIRGQDFELYIDSVYLEKGKQLIFSIDLKDIPKHVKFYNRTSYYTEGEKSILRKSIFTYQHTGTNREIYVWQNDVIYRSRNGKSQMNFGPFAQNQQLNLIRKNEFHNPFLFEPSYRYQIEKTRERLYHVDAFPSDRNIYLRTMKARTDLGEQLYLDRNIPIFDKTYQRPLIQQQISETTKNFKYQVARGKTKYRIVVPDSTLLMLMFVNQKTKSIKYFPGSRRHFHNMRPGNYTIYGYTNWGHYFTHEITVRKDTMLYQQLGKMDYQFDNNLELLKSLFPTKGNVVKPEIGQNNTTKPTQKPKETITYTGPVFSVSGKVTDEEGYGVIAATILIKGTKIGVITDIDGNYTIDIPTEIENPVLVISYIGFNTTEVAIGDGMDYNIAMSENQDVLDEVVVVGYGTVMKTESVASMSITKDQVQRLPKKDVSKLLSGQVAGVSVESSEADLKIRGSRTGDVDYYIDGVKVTGDTIDFGALLASSKIRSNFSDYAFWQSNLITDGKGEATFRVTYPDDITSYQTFVIGMDRRHNFGIATKNVKSQKTALAQLAVPRFMIQGDKANIIGKSLNYSNDSLRIKSTFLSENDILESNEFWLKNAKIETTALIANTDKDTLLLTYKMEHPKFFDGEKRPIPIYRKGIEETLGSFNILEGDTTITLTFDEDKGNVKLYAQTDILEVLLQDVRYLIDYPYGCNEQTASRLMALLLDKQIKTALGQNPPKDELIIKMIKRLEKAQNPNGSWGWWRGNEANYWMTNYVLKSLYAADTSGYKSDSYELGLRFITNSLNEIPTYELLNSIELLSDVQQNMDFEKHLVKIDSTIRYNDYYNQIRMIKIKQNQGLDYDLLVLDSLEKSTLFGNIFYDIDRSAQPYYRWYWYSNHYNLTQLAYQVLKNETIKQNGEYDVKLAAIRGYFLEKRSRYGWRNTFTTAQILSTILPDMVSASNRVKPQLVIKGNTTETVTKFPFETTFYANTPLEIQKTGTSMVYLTGYQQFWNEQPKPKNDIFELKSKLVQEGKTVKKLAAKTPTKMVVTLEVKKEADYVMVEVPIPAGCSYGEKSRGYGYWYGREVHREYFREKTCVFYQNLPVGTYTIEINLEPRFTGEYTVNPAKAEQMYFPVFYGRNAIKEVMIIEK